MADLKNILYTGLDPSHYKGKGKLTHLPLIRIVPRPLDDPLLQQAFALFPHYTHVVVSSKNTVQILQHYLLLMGFSLRDWANKMTIAIGLVTAGHLRAHAIEPTSIAKEETAEGLIRTLDSLPLENSFIFWPHSSLSRPLLATYFCQHQIAFQECLLYDTLPHRPNTLPSLDQFDEIVFTSPSTVDAFLQIFGSLPLQKTLTSIGPITQAHLRRVCALP